MSTESAWKSQTKRPNNRHECQQNLLCLRVASHCILCFPIFQVFVKTLIVSNDCLQHNSHKNILLATCYRTNIKVFVVFYVEDGTETGRFTEHITELNKSQECSESRTCVCGQIRWSRAAESLLRSRKRTNCSRRRSLHWNRKEYFRMFTQRLGRSQLWTFGRCRHFVLQWLSRYHTVTHIDKLPNTAIARYPASLYTTVKLAIFAIINKLRYFCRLCLSEDAENVKLGNGESAASSSRNRKSGT